MPLTDRQPVRHHPDSKPHGRPARPTRGIWVSAAYALILLATGAAEVLAADTAHDRVALFLSGNECPAQRRAIAEILSHSPGVKGVDMTAIPDHALVDIVVGATTGEALSEIVRTQLTTTSDCRVEVMKSCISAGPVDAHAAH